MPSLSPLKSHLVLETKTQRRTSIHIPLSSLYRSREKQNTPFSTMFTSTTMSNSESLAHDLNPFIPQFTPISHDFSHLPKPHIKKKRNQPGNPDPEAEVVSLSPNTLMATNRFVCDICNKGFQRDQNLQLHRRGHNLPWKLRVRSTGKEEQVVRKRVYVCPERSCVHHQPSRALGDITGIKKHFCRKHGEKKWRCERCSKKYAVHSDWKAHVKTCGTREYRCDCGALFSRKDSFVTHRAFCDALAEECARLSSATAAANSPLLHHPFSFPFSPFNPLPNTSNPNPSSTTNPNPNIRIPFDMQPQEHLLPLLYPTITPTSPQLSAATLLPSTAIDATGRYPARFNMRDISIWQRGDRQTRDFLGVASDKTREEELLSLTGMHCLDLVTTTNRDHDKPLAAFGFSPVAEAWGDC